MQVGTVLEHLCKLAICSSRENSPALSSVCFFYLPFFLGMSQIQPEQCWTGVGAQHNTEHDQRRRRRRRRALLQWLSYATRERTRRASSIRKTISISNSWSAVTCQSCVVSTAWVAEQAATSKLTLVRRCIRDTLPPGVSV